MKAKALLIMGGAILLLSGLGNTAYAENTDNSSDLMADYLYDIPANSWYAAKVKPKMKAKIHSEWAYTPPPSTYGYTDNSPVAHKPEPIQALPFWNDLPNN